MFDSPLVSRPLRPQAGLTLLELVVTLLILTMLASVAIRSTSGVQDQARWEQTKRRLEMIREAILGDPARTVNGSPEISGFVADMGRLPNNLHELLEQAYCQPDRTERVDTTCNANYGAGSWLVQTPSGLHAQTGLRYGWNGPYLHSSQNPSDSDAFTDGWGREAQNSADQNYGWALGFNVSGAGSLLVESYGSDHADGPNNNCNDYGDDCTELIPANDYMVDISTGITFSFFIPLAYAPKVAGMCSANDAPTHKIYTSEESCAASSVGGIWQTCSDVTKTTRVDCEAASEIWYGEGYGCEDPLHPHHTDCTANSKTWRSCSAGATAGTYTTKSTCETAGGIWFDDWGYGGGFGCSDPSFSQAKKDCEDNGKSWRFPARKICMNLLIRTVDVNGNTVVNNISSAPISVREQGSGQTLHFPLPGANQTECENNHGSWDAGSNQCLYLVAQGKNAIGIYEYDGDCDPQNNALYPADRSGPVLVDFHPRTALPVLNW